MPDGGRLTLAAREAAGSVELSVSDTGSGMSDEVRSRVFDPFFTTKAKAGMGLGLAVSFSIVRRHEGTVTVESKLGAGTQFIIRLPIATENVSVALDLTRASVSQALLSRAGVARILVVEDEDYVRDLMQEILESAGNEIIVAGSGVEALALLEQHEFDAVFTDVGLPGMSGWELTRRIRELYGDIPIAIVTGWGDAVGSDELKEQNINWVVTKPFTVERLTLLANEVARFRDESIGGNMTLIEHDATNSDVLN